MTANEDFFDAMLRHQIGVLRLSGHIRNKLFNILDATEQDLSDKIRSRLMNVKGPGPKAIARLQKLEKIITTLRGSAWNKATEVWFEELTALALAEPGFIAGALSTVLPVIVDLEMPSTQLLKTLVTTRPFEGRVLKEWASDLKRADIKRIMDQINIGVVQGEGSDVIARRVVGTKVLRGVDGITQASRRQVAAVTRTAVNHISNQARREFFDENATLFKEEVYVATLDSRTTPICRSLDGKRFPVGEGPIPPLHFGCRSLRTVVIDGEIVGDRPAKPFTESMLLREFSDREGLGTISKRSLLPRGTVRQFDAYKRQRVRELTGPVPARTTYQEWLGRQPVSFQNETLGVTRAKLFRKGGLQLDRFVNRAGDEIPLSQLARIERQAFIDAGLDPTKF